MSQCRASCLCVGAEGSKVGSGGGSDVLTHDECNAKINRQHACGAQENGDGHYGSRRLYDASYQGANKQEDDDGEMAASVEGAEKSNYCGIMFKVEFLSGTAE